MFQRQWFDERMQIGLKADSIQFEALMKSGKLETAYNMTNDIKGNEDYWQRMKQRVIGMRDLKQKQTGKRIVLVGWIGFWPGFDIYNNQLLDYIKLATTEVDYVTTRDLAEANLIMVSCYGDISKLWENQKAKRILFLGENIRPSYTHFDASLSFDICNYQGRNVYLPLWMLEIDWLNKREDYPDRRIYPITEFTRRRTTNMKNRLAKVVFVGNNSEPFRYSIVQHLEKNGLIDVYGSHTKPVDDKIELLKRYRMTIAMENSIYPGYITEKGIHAYIAGTPAIYWGDKEEGGFFSRNKLFRSVETRKSLEDIESIVRKAVSNENNLHIEPLFEKEKLRNYFFKSISGIRGLLAEFT